MILSFHSVEISGFFCLQFLRELIFGDSRKPESFRSYAFLSGRFLVLHFIIIFISVVFPNDPKVPQTSSKCPPKHSAQIFFKSIYGPNIDETGIPNYAHIEYGLRSAPSELYSKRYKKVAKITIKSL